jgi:spartin
MDEDDGEIVGTLDRSVRVYEDPSIGERGREQDTLVVEVPEGADTQDGLLEEEVLVSTIPPEERDWMVKSAVFVSHAISGTTTLLTSAMTSASNLYIAHSTPSTTPSAPGSAAASPRPTTPSSSSSVSQKGRGQGQGQGHPPAPPSRTLLLLQSPTTQKSLAQIHAVSGSAAQLSSKAVTTVESLIQRAIGSGSSSFNSNSSSSSNSNSSVDRGKGKGRASPSTDTVKSPTPRPQPQPQQPQQQQQAPTGTAPAPLRTRTSVALSAALILASIEASAVRLVDAGGAAVSAAVTHKYGTTAGENAALAGRTARNIVLVYVDVRGLGRRVIVKRMAKTWVRGRIASTRQEREAAAAAQKKR